MPKTVLGMLFAVGLSLGLSGCCGSNPKQAPVVRGQAPMDPSTVPANFAPAGYCPQGQGYAGAAYGPQGCPPGHAGAAYGPQGGPPGAYPPAGCPGFSGYREPRNSVYPGQATGGADLPAVVQYPYYTLKGPDDFFRK